MKTMVETLHELRKFESWEGDRFKWQPALLRLSYTVVLHGGQTPLWTASIHDNTGEVVSSGQGINVLDSADAAMSALRELINQNKVELREV